MKTLAFLIALTFGFTAFAQKRSIPEAVKTSFEKAYPNAQHVRWEEQADMQYEVEFEDRDLEMEALYDKDGNILETEKEIELGQLPEAIANYVRANHPDFEIDDAFIVKKGTVTQYEVELEKHGDNAEPELLFDHLGNFIGMEDGNEEDD